MRTFVSASAVGIYGYDRGDALLCEDSARGDGFLADVVADWEDATGPAAEAGLRVVTVRTGIVQAAAGGTLRLLRPLFSAGLGGRLGTGRQWLSWVGIDDLLDIYYRALYDTRLSGPVNAVGPNPVRNSEYTRALAATMHRPALLPVPSIGPRLLLGEQGARELAEADQRVLPTRLQALGHRFRHSTVEDALAHQLGHDPAPGCSESDPPRVQVAQQRVLLVLVAGHPAQDVVEHHHGIGDVGPLFSITHFGALRHGGVADFGPRRAAGLGQLLEHLGPR